MNHDLTYSEVNEMSVEALCEYHDHKALMHDMEAEAEMEQWRRSSLKTRGRAPYRRVY